MPRCPCPCRWAASGCRAPGRRGKVPWSSREMRRGNSRRRGRRGGTFRAGAPDSWRRPLHDSARRPGTRKRTRPRNRSFFAEECPHKRGQYGKREDRNDERGAQCREIDGNGDERCRDRCHAFKQQHDWPDDEHRNFNEQRELEEQPMNFATTARASAS